MTGSTTLAPLAFSLSIIVALYVALNIALVLR